MLLVFAVGRCKYVMEDLLYLTLVLFEGLSRGGRRRALRGCRRSLLQL